MSNNYKSKSRKCLGFHIMPYTNNEQGSHVGCALGQALSPKSQCECLFKFDYFSGPVGLRDKIVK